MADSTTPVSLSGNATYTNDDTLDTTKTAVAIDLANSQSITIANGGTIESGNRGIDATGTAVSGESITIDNTGTIQGSDDGIRINADMPGGTVSLTNSGTITSTTDGQAIDFDALETASSVTITNQAGGVITSTDADAVRPGGNAVVDNAGTIYAGGANGATKNDGIDFQSHSGTVNNSGTISGARHGITSDTGVTVSNTGSITGRDGSGVGSDGDGTVTNSGTITGAYDGSGTGDGDGVDIDGLATITNYGTIQGTGAAGDGSDGLPNTSEGVSIGGGSVVNAAGATISGANNGILVDNSSQGDAPYATTVTNAGTIQGLDGYGIVITDTFGDTITNSGTISGTTDAILLGSGNDTLNIETGSVINGTVDGGAGTNIVNLSGSGTFAGAVDFQTLNVSGTWLLSGDQSYTSLNVADGASVTLEGAASAGETVTFGGAGTLVLDAPANFAATVAGFGAGDALVFAGLSYTGSESVSIAGTTLTVTSGDVSYSVTLADAPTGDVSAARAADGALELVEVACFLPGSRILTPAGERAVEALRVGELVTTLVGGRHVAQPVAWIGTQEIETQGNPERFPVRIARDAVAPGVPTRDLFVTPEHCLFLGGGLIPARMLVNGGSIARVPRCRYRVFHVETPRHAIILAEGLATESFLDTGNRRHFAQPGVLAVLPTQSPKNWVQDAAAPLLVQRAHVEPVWRALSSRAAGLGYLLPDNGTVTDEPELRLRLADGRLLTPVHVADGQHLFALPKVTTGGRQAPALLSRSDRPSDVIGPFLDDRRQLGVLVLEIVAQGPDGDVPLAFSTMGEAGWHAPEAGTAARWTDGAASVALPSDHAVDLISVRIGAAGPYRVTEAARVARTA